MGEEGMIIEGGTGATADIIVQQIEELGIEPSRITYLVLTHTHADHIGAVSPLRLRWPHLKLLTNAVGEKMLSNEGMLREFLWVDRSITELMKSKREIAQAPPKLEVHNFAVDTVIKEGDQIDLGSGIVWTFYDTPGHSLCQISLYEGKEGTLVIGDTTGFCYPDRNIYWPNYFTSLEDYCTSIRKLSTLGAERCALSHNNLVEGGVRIHLERALKSTEDYHEELLKRLGDGEDPDKLALEKAQWVQGITDILPFKVMHNLCKVLIKRSQKEADKNIPFSIPTEN
jgi:glyoxylase-like metal-dependent hydrolase (beta-lactamase superfamily II)